MIAIRFVLSNPHKSGNYTRMHGKYGVILCNTSESLISPDRESPNHRLFSPTIQGTAAAIRGGGSASCESNCYWSTATLFLVGPYPTTEVEEAATVIILLCAVAIFAYIIS